MHTQPTERRWKDDYGRRHLTADAAPLRVFGGFQIARHDWYRDEDGWQCEYDVLDLTVYATEAECQAAIDAAQAERVAA